MSDRLNKTLCISAMVGGLLAMGASPTFAQNTTVRIGMDTAAIMNLPIFVADQNGFFQEEGLDIEYFTMAGGAASMAALLGGSVDMISAGTVSLVKVAGQGQDVVAIAGVQQDAVVSVVIRSEVAESLGGGVTLADLEGLRIGTLSKGGFSDMGIRYLLTDAGLDPDADVAMLQFRSFENLLTAGQAGQVDAGLVIEPWNVVATEQLEGWEYVVRITAEEGPELLRDSAYDTLQTSRRYIQNNPETVASFLHALERATALTQDASNLDQLVDIAKAAIPNADEAVLRSSIQSQIGTWRTQMTPEQIERSIALLVETGNMSDSIPTYDQVVHTFQ